MPSPTRSRRADLSRTGSQPDCIDPPQASLGPADSRFSVTSSVCSPRSALPDPLQVCGSTSAECVVHAGDRQDRARSRSDHLDRSATGSSHVPNTVCIAPVQGFAERPAATTVRRAFRRRGNAPLIRRECGHRRSQRSSRACSRPAGSSAKSRRAIVTASRVAVADSWSRAASRSFDAPAVLLRAIVWHSAGAFASKRPFVPLLRRDCAPWHISAFSSAVRRSRSAIRASARIVRALRRHSLGHAAFRSRLPPAMIVITGR